MKVCIVGLGLLGGSLGLALKRSNGDYYITGVDTNEQHSALALESGIADEISTFKHGVSTSDLVVLATPVDTIMEMVSPALDLLSPHAILTDMGSTKSGICKIADEHKNRGRFIACHPIAGTENSGPKAAFAELLSNKMLIICDEDKSDTDALTKLTEIYKHLSLRVEFMNSKAHDIHIAYVSHLSHISSFALGATVLEKEKNEKNIFIMAGSGFDSTVRLAKSSPDMWTPIFSQNKENISEALGIYIEKLKSFKEMLDLDDQKSTHSFMASTNDIRRVLNNPDED